MSEQRLCGCALCQEKGLSIAYGQCHCGCEENTSIISKTAKTIGRIKGEPYRFKCGHGSRRHQPPSYKQLSDLYLRQGMSISDIAKHLSKLSDGEKSPSRWVIYNWLRRKLKEVRTRTDAIKLASRQGKMDFKRMQRASASRRRELIKTGELKVKTSQLHTPRARKKGVKARQKVSNQHYETRRCAVCGESITRIKSLFRGAVAVHAGTCTGKYRGRLSAIKRRRKVSRPIYTNKTTILPDWLTDAERAQLQKEG